MEIVIHGKGNFIGKKHEERGDGTVEKEDDEKLFRQTGRSVLLTLLRECNITFQQYHPVGIKRRREKRRLTFSMRVARSGDGD